MSRTTGRMRSTCSSPCALIRTASTLRILYVSQRAHPSVGGIENLQWAVARNLARRHEVTILAERVDAGPYGRLDGVLRSPPRFAPISAAGVAIRQLRLTPGQRLLNVPLALNASPVFRRHAYGSMRRRTAAWYGWVASAAGRLAQTVAQHDVVHVWGGDYMAVAAVRAAQRTNRPAIVTPFAHPGQWGDDPGSAIAYREADAVVGLLHADADTYRRLGVADRSLFVVGVCAAEPPVSEIDVRARHDVRGPIALFLGVRRAYKGFDRFLAAAPLLAKLNPDVTLACVGPGAPVDVENQPLRVIDRGRVSDDERSAWLRAADVLVLPSEGEIFPVSILEAFSVGTPVITSDLETLAELVATSGGGWTTPCDPASLASTLATVLADPSERSSRGQRGHAFWRRDHTVDAVVQRYEHLYDEIRSRRERAMQR